MVTREDSKQSTLHQLDARLKICLCLGLVIMSFGAHAWLQLMVVIIGALLLILAADSPWPRLWKTWWSLRWLLCFSFLMHLLLSPGRMMFGTRWLSFDGLFQGLFVCSQLSVAILCAMLLSYSTSMDELAAALSWFMAPLARLGCPVNDWHRQVLLVLKFLPIVRAEYLAVQKIPSNSTHTRILSFLDTWVMRVKELLDRLILKAEELTDEIVSGRIALRTVNDWPSLNLFKGLSARISLVAIGFTVLYSLTSML